jgi:hypothetical protein
MQRAVRAGLAACLAACLTALAFAGPPNRDGPPVYPDPPGQGPVLVYVGPEGLGLEAVTLADVEARWGPPEEVKRFPRANRSGGHLRWRYPSRGLQFEVNAADADDRNPRVGYLTLALPYAGRTPQGLYLGMPQAEAEAILQRHYTVRSRHKVSWGGGARSEERGETVSGSNPGWRRSQTVSFTFRQGRLHDMQFQLKPKPWVEPSTLRSMASFIILFTLILAGHWLVRRLRRGMGVWWGRAQALLGLGLLVGAVLLGMVAVGSFNGDGFDRLLGMVLGVGAFGLGAVGAAMLGTAFRRRD